MLSYFLCSSKRAVTRIYPNSDSGSFKGAVSRNSAKLGNFKVSKVGGGAGSEVWNRVYMIAPVKKFGRVRLSTIFLQNKYQQIWWRMQYRGTMSFCSVLSFAASKHQEKVFKNIFKGIFGHQEA